MFPHVDFVRDYHYHICFSFKKTTKVEKAFFFFTFDTMTHQHYSGDDLPEGIDEETVRSVFAQMGFANPTSESIRATMQRVRMQQQQDDDEEDNDHEDGQDEEFSDDEEQQYDEDGNDVYYALHRSDVTAQQQQQQHTTTSKPREYHYQQQQHAPPSSSSKHSAPPQAPQAAAAARASIETADSSGRYRNIQGGGAVGKSATTQRRSPLEPDPAVRTPHELHPNHSAGGPNINSTTKNVSAVHHTNPNKKQQPLISQEEEHQDRVPSSSRKDPLNTGEPLYAHQQHYKGYLDLVRRFGEENIEFPLAATTAAKPVSVLPQQQQRPQSAGGAEGRQRPASATVRQQQQHGHSARGAAHSTCVHSDPNRVASLYRNAASPAASSVIYAAVASSPARYYTATTNPMAKSCAAGATAGLRARNDPVSRGQRMRQQWQEDPFLSQKGRKEDRWQVRQSMLGWKV